MSEEKVQEAIIATRAGKKREAQFLLTEALQEDPNDAHAWFLLGNLVDSPEKQMAYLGKALTINPQYEKARQQLNYLQRRSLAAPTTVATDEEEPLVVTVKEEEETAVVTESPELPDWLEEQLDDEGIEEAIAEAEEVMAVEAKDEEKEAVATAVTPPTPTATESDPEQQLRLYNQLLIFLIVLIVLVLIALIWSL